MNDLDFAEATDKLRNFSESLAAVSKGEIQTSISTEANPGPVDRLNAAFATLKRDVAVAGKRARAKAREPLRTLEESRRAAVKRARQTASGGGIITPLSTHLSKRAVQCFAEEES